MTWRSASLGLASAVLLLLLCAEPGAAKDDALPACDAARKFYKAGKLYDVLGLKKTAEKKDIRK